MEAVHLRRSLMAAIHVSVLLNFGITALKIPTSRGRDNDGCEPVVLAAKEFPQGMTYIVDNKRFYGNPGNESKPVKWRHCEIDEENSASEFIKQPHDCADIQAIGVNVSGVYGISPGGNGLSFNVYCDMETDGGGWTVFQRRMDGSLAFSRKWLEYKNGFGSISSEHWLGNEKIHRLSNQKSYELRIDLEDINGITAHSIYKNFRLSNETGNYKLTLGTCSYSTAGCTFKVHAGNEFSTRDRNNSNITYCRTYTGWWYHEETCYYCCNLNGIYRGSLVWWPWRGIRSIKATEMKIRPM